MRKVFAAAILFCAAGAQAVEISEPNGAGLKPGTLPDHWMTGGPNCVSVPDWQVHEYNDDFYILRESGCIHFEKPFLYLIFGSEKALLEDTGAGEVQTAPFVMDLLAKWAKRSKHAPVKLVVIHSHAHGDHIAGDKQFQAMPEVEFIDHTPEAVSKAAGIAKWPADIGSIDLGGRVVDVIPIPGHNDASITLYDRVTGNLLTGDSLYPGRLTVPDLPAGAESAKRLVAFVETHPIAYVLGTHIEQMRAPYLDYPRGTTYQPDEHALALTRGSVFELNQVFLDMNGTPRTVAEPEFTVISRKPTAKKN